MLSSEMSPHVCIHSNIMGWIDKRITIQLIVFTKEIFYLHAIKYIFNDHSLTQKGYKWKYLNLRKMYASVNINSIKKDHHIFTNYLQGEISFTNAFLLLNCPYHPHSNKQLYSRINHSYDISIPGPIHLGLIQNYRRLNRGSSTHMLLPLDSRVRKLNYWGFKKDNSNRRGYFGIYLLYA